jgi:hypothetical protein
MISPFFQEYARKNDRNIRLFHPIIRWNVLDSGARIVSCLGKDTSFFFAGAGFQDCPHSLPEPVAAALGPSFGRKK